MVLRGWLIATAVGGLGFFVGSGQVILFPAIFAAITILRAAVVAETMSHEDPASTEVIGKAIFMGIAVLNGWCLFGLGVASTIPFHALPTVWQGTVVARAVLPVLAMHRKIRFKGSRLSLDTRVDTVDGAVLLIWLPTETAVLWLIA